MGAIGRLVAAERLDQFTLAAAGGERTGDGSECPGEGQPVVTGDLCADSNHGNTHDRLDYDIASQAESLHHVAVMRFVGHHCRRARRWTARGECV